MLGLNQLAGPPVSLKTDSGVSVLLGCCCSVTIYSLNNNLVVSIDNMKLFLLFCILCIFMSSAAFRMFQTKRALSRTSRFVATEPTVSVSSKLQIQEANEVELKYDKVCETFYCVNCNVPMNPQSVPMFR